ncbi:uncharacterized protein [Argopecten irradians]|uniref:uncharacterized protein isoform X2 n=1 Tax=Argopecten irradians TaxID=31199 RepID=UPI00371D1D43
MDSKAIFSPKPKELRTYGRTTICRDRPRGIFLQKKQIEAPAVNTSGNFSLSESDDIPKVKDNNRKLTNAKQSKKSNGVLLQKRTRKAAKAPVTKKQTKATPKENIKDKMVEKKQMKPTPKHGLDQSNQLWVKTKIRGSDIEEDSIELPRRDQDITWQEKISLLMPKMTFGNQQHTDRKMTGMESVNRKVSGYPVLNLSAEEVIEDEESSSVEDEADHIRAVPRVSAPKVINPRLSLDSPPHGKPHKEDDKENNTSHSKLSQNHTSSEEYTYTYEWITDSGNSLPVSRQTSKSTQPGTDKVTSSTAQNCSDIYTYDWVTDSGQVHQASSQYSTCPSTQIQQKGERYRPSEPLVLDTFGNNENSEKSCVWRESNKERRSYGYFNSTKKPGALNVLQAKFPEDLSVITNSPSHCKENIILYDKSSLSTGETKKGLQQMNSTRKKDGLEINMIKLPDMSAIERISPLKEQDIDMNISKTLTKDDKVPYYLSSTRKNGGLEFDKDKFEVDVSEIKEFSNEDRPEQIQLLQEVTPKARQKETKRVKTPVKCDGVVPKKKRKLLPQSSTVLFVTGCTGELSCHTPSLSAITGTQNTVENGLEDKGATEGHSVKRTRSREKHLCRSGPNSWWKEDAKTSGKILTSTPVSSTQKQTQRPDINLTCVPRPCFEDELEIHESIEVNSNEIVPADLGEDSIEEWTSVPEKQRRFEKKDNQRKADGYKKLQVSFSSICNVKSSLLTAPKCSNSSFSRKLSVKPITKPDSSSKIMESCLTDPIAKTVSSAKITECCLTDPSFVFPPTNKSALYMEVSQKMFKDKAELSEDILFTHRFKRR